MNDKSIDINTPGGYVYGATDIRQCWGLILNSVKGSDPLRPEFGCGIFDFVDKPVSEFVKSYPQIIADLQTWEPRASVNTVNHTVSANGIIIINISGIYTATGDIVSATISLDDLAILQRNIVNKSYSNNYNQSSYS